VAVIGVIVVLLGVLVSIALHEVGHMVPAKRFGVKVTKYMVGFGHTLWSRTRGETEYGIKAIPLGGYVRMIGMYPPARPAADGRVREGFFASLAEDARQVSAEEVGPGEESRTFYSLSVPKKLVVMLAGPGMNLLIAVVLIAVVVLGFGAPALTNTLGAVAPCVVAANEDRGCEAGDPAAPGAAGGLEAGDTVIRWNDAEVSDWAQVSEAIRAGGTDPATVVVLRDGEEVTLVVTPVLAERPVYAEDGSPVTDASGEQVTQEVPFVGIGPTYERVPQSIAAVPALTGDALVQTVRLVATIPQQVVDAWQAATGVEERGDGVMSLVGVGRIAGEITSVEADVYTTSDRVADLLGLLASLNIALFVFNLIPLPPLDGGHVAGALWEGVRRRVARWRGRPDPGPVDVARAIPLAYGVVVALIGMSLVLVYADIVAPITLGG